jgi:hypothetical protein
MPVVRVKSTSAERDRGLIRDRQMGRHSHPVEAADDRAAITLSWSGCSADTKSAAARISVLGSRDYRGRLLIWVNPNSLVFDELASDMTVPKPFASHLAAHRSIEGAVVRQADGDPLAAEFANTIARALMQNFLDRRPLGPEP